MKTPGSGRTKGTPNKKSAAVKEALEAAFDGIGGLPALISWAQSDEGRTEFYKLWGKLIPKDITVGGTGGGPIKLVILTGVPESKADGNKPD